ncbi:MAG: metallophosphoesterase [Methanobacterium sp.]|uniref:metallophosphoesterase n=1 Tax=Methanobacterium sp. TaxID=2164 RepID=UPI003D65474A|nr:metallophosphoesterase [Methanobacterium sp.]
MNSKKTVKSLNVKTNILFSDKVEDPSVIDSAERIELIFSEDLDMGTVRDGIKLYKLKSDGKEQEIDVKINVDKNSQSVLYIRKSEAFSEGEEYKLSITGNVKSVNGASIREEFVNYFAVDYSFNLNSEGISDLNNERSLIICISDLHLGANDAYAELTHNRDALVNFLEHIRTSPNVKELVIAGDLIDEWFIPMHLDTFNGKTQLDFTKAVASNNKPVFDAFNNIIKEDNVKVTYVPGNHDILINSEDIQSIMPGISQSRDVRGLGAHTPTDFPELVIEHGHRYNFYCAPDYSNQSLTQTDTILPPGYFFTRMATSSVVQGRPKLDIPFPPVKKNDLGEVQFFYFLYWNVWKGLISDFPVEEGLFKKAINTGIDGFSDCYAIADVLPYQNSEDDYIDVNLYKGIIEGWDERQSNNLVSVKIPTDEAVLKGAFASHLDEQSGVQFFKNPDSDKRIVIFGHSHEARVITSFNEKEEKQVYVNSGTWIDKNKCTMTFVVVVPPKSEDSALAYVSLYQYSPSGDIKKLESQALTNIK